MKNRKTIIALLIAILGLSGILIWDANQTTKEEEAKKTEKLIFSFAPESIVSAHLVNRKNNNKIEISLEKKPAGWFLTSPVSVVADQQAANQLVVSIAQLKYDEKIAEDKKAWPQYELQPAPLTLELKDGKGKTYSISAGAKTQTGYSVYVGIQETGHVYTATYSFEQTLNKTVLDLRNKGLAALPTGALKEMTYRSPEPLTVKFAVQNGMFQITSPEKLPTSQTDVMKFVSDLSELRATEIKDAPGPDFKSKFDNSVASYEVSWTTTDNNRGLFRFSVFDSELWATDDSGKIYLKFDRERDQPKVRKSLTDFRDKQILKFSEDDVVSAVVDGKKTDKIEGQNRLLMQDLGNLKALDFTNKLPPSAVANQPTHSVQVSLKANKNIDVKLWKVGQDVFVKTSLSTYIYKTNDVILNSLKL